MNSIDFNFYNDELFEDLKTMESYLKEKDEVISQMCSDKEDYKALFEELYFAFYMEQSRAFSFALQLYKQLDLIHESIHEIEGELAIFDSEAMDFVADMEEFEKNLENEGTEPARDGLEIEEKRHE